MKVKTERVVYEPNSFIPSLEEFLNRVGHNNVLNVIPITHNTFEFVVVYKETDESSMKYKVGDKVFVRSWDDLASTYGFNGLLEIREPETAKCLFDKALMKQFCEQELLIKEVHLLGYICASPVSGERVRGYWEDWMFKEDETI